MEIQFRPAALDDEDIVVPLIYSSSPQTFDYLFSVNSQAQSLEFLHAAYRNPQGQFSHSEHTVITVDDQVVGCGCLSDSDTGAKNLLGSLKQIVAFYGFIKSTEVIRRATKVERVIEAPKPGIAHISNLGAAPQGQGYGSRLIEYFTAQAQSEGYRQIALDVAHSNRAAYSLYKRMNFMERRHNEADDNRKWGRLESHIYMEKDIPTL